MTETLVVVGVAHRRLDPADHGVVDGRLDEPRYKKSSIGCLEVSPDRVVTAIAFQSEMTLGSPAAAAGAAAVAVPLSRAKLVGRDGIEPPTLRFSAARSTD